MWDDWGIVKPTKATGVVIDPEIGFAVSAKNTSSCLCLVHLWVSQRANRSKSSHSLTIIDHNYPWNSQKSKSALSSSSYFGWASLLVKISIFCWKIWHCCCVSCATFVDLVPVFIPYCQHMSTCHVLFNQMSTISRTYNHNSSSENTVPRSSNGFSIISNNLHCHNLKKPYSICSCLYNKVIQYRYYNKSCPIHYI
jgi:hypothetical protein